MNLKALYHPSGLTGGLHDNHRPGECPCGCNIYRQWVAFEQGAKQLGIRDTPGMRAVVALEKEARKNNPKPKRVSKPWKGATVTRDEIEVAERCEDLKCQKEHEYLDIEDDPIRCHWVIVPATVYHLGTARAAVRADRKSPIRL